MRKGSFKDRLCLLVVNHILYHRDTACASNQSGRANRIQGFITKVPEIDRIVLRYTSRASVEVRKVEPQLSIRSGENGMIERSLRCKKRVCNLTIPNSPSSLPACTHRNVTFSTSSPAILPKSTNIACKLPSCTFVRTPRRLQSTARLSTITSIGLLPPLQLPQS